MGETGQPPRQEQASTWTGISISDLTTVENIIHGTSFRGGSTLQKGWQNFSRKPGRKRKKYTRGGGRRVVTAAARCSFHVFVAYRVYSPIRFAVSMGTHGKTYRFSLSTPLKETSFKNPLALLPLLSSSPGSLFVSSLLPELFLPRQPRLSGFAGKRERMEAGRMEEGRIQRGCRAPPLKEVYFANKAGLVLCLLKQ